MTTFEELTKEFNTYNLLIFDLSKMEESTILDKSFDILSSNNISYPQISLGFQHFIHKSKDKMELTEKYVNRKKIYLVTSLFEKNIDYKPETDSGIPYTSINNGIEQFIKDNIDEKLPPLLNRAFLKIWEMLTIFDLIPANENFTSSHLAEGPGSFIQATIYFRELQEKLGLIKSAAKDNYYGVTLHADHEHLQMQQEFIKYFSKEKIKRLHILETKSVKEIKDMYGGSFKGIITNGDLTKINTIKAFGGSKDVEPFAKLSDLVTADGGFDWKKENLQEQEAYKLILGEIVSAIKVQKDGGNFVLKIFESYTYVTLKMIELLRAFYKEVYICKPYTSRISNSEKYIICKNFKKSILTSTINKKLEDFITIINKNESFNIIDIISDYKISQKNIDIYKNINIQLMIKQYIGINNIVLFDKLDNKNGIEYNDFLDNQIIASTFWNNLFLNTKNFNKLHKFVKNYDYLKFKSTIDVEPESPTIKEDKTETKTKQSRAVNKKINKSTKNTKSKKNSKTKQKGGNIESSDEVLNIIDSYESLDSLKENNFGKLDSDSEDGFIDLSTIPNI
jgi:23S rRNA U2552 (ribose-2'-O)-methylase RlmE/FtsJ